MGSLDFPFINCEIEHDLTWSKNCLIYDILITSKVGEDSWVDETETAEVRFKIDSSKLYVQVVTLSLNANIKFLENIKQLINIDLK